VSLASFAHHFENGQWDRDRFDWINDEELRTNNGLKHGCATAVLLKKTSL
jgi:hypothetical protein